MLPLHVFEDRYRVLVRERREFGVVLIREGRDVGGEPLINEVGTVAEVAELEELPDGRFAVLCHGGRRFRIRGLDRSRPYLVAEVEYLPAAAPAPPSLVAALGRYLAVMGVDVTLRPSTEMNAELTWLAGSILQVEPSKLEALLESGDPRLAEALLSEEAARMRRMGLNRSLHPNLPSPN
ncbi:MAG: LON peptidase substrate-binding domain-containing protein [Candidatus Dormibacteraeota bacterium]|nr:LON peptidase substrate-binding domain-containing protein [Candidatus Dormibacteraeota bacterium]